LSLFVAFIKAVDS